MDTDPHQHPTDQCAATSADGPIYLAVDAAKPGSEQAVARTQCAGFNAQNLAHAVLSVAASAGDAPAIITAEGAYSYNDLATAIVNCATQLKQREDFATGDRVGILLDNSLEYLATFYGVLLAGGVATPLPPTIEAYRLSRILENCQTRLVVSSQRILKRRKTTTPPAATIDLLAPAMQCQNNVTAVDDAGGMDSTAPDGSDLAMILFTSGSSGEPKGVMLSHRNLLENARSITQYLPIQSEDRALTILPFYHAYGNSVVQSHLLRGASLVVDGSLTFPETVVEALVEHQATSFAGVPEVYHALLQYSSLGETPLPHFRYATVAGGALRPAAAAEVSDKIAPASFYVMYGQSEATARLAYLPPEDAARKAGSIGKAIPGVELSIRDEAGNAVAAGVQGELCARGPNISPGYFRDPETTARVFRDGWLHTGDLATEDDDGFYFVQARISDLVKIQGHRLHPREVEEAVAAALPGVRVAVAAFEHGHTMRLALFAIAPTSQTLTVPQLRKVCQQHLPRVKTPTHFEIVTEFPRNASMKLDRGNLSRRAASAIETTSQRKTA